MGTKSTQDANPKELQRSTPKNRRHNTLGLQEDTFYEIFKYLDRLDLVRIGSVCKTWYRLSSNQVLWEQIACRRWGQSFVQAMTETTNKVDWKKLCCCDGGSIYVPEIYFSSIHTREFHKKKRKITK